VVAYLRSMIRGSRPLAAGRLLAVAAFLLLASPLAAHFPAPIRTATTAVTADAGVGNSSAVNNFTASIDRLVDLVALAGSGILALVWARVALSWFSNDITKKVQAKDRARDALVGTLLFTAAITGLFWGLAHWVLTGT